jgi:hypothetical protein
MAVYPQWFGHVPRLNYAGGPNHCGYTAKHYPDHGFIQSASASSVGPAPADQAEAAQPPKNVMNPSTCSVVRHRDSRKQISFLAGHHRPAGFAAKPA